MTYCCGGLEFTLKDYHKPPALCPAFRSYLLLSSWVYLDRWRGTAPSGTFKGQFPGLTPLSTRFSSAFSDAFSFPVSHNLWKFEEVQASHKQHVDKNGFLVLTRQNPHLWVTERKQPKDEVSGGNFIFVSFDWRRQTPSSAQALVVQW